MAIVLYSLRSTHNSKEPVSVPIGASLGIASRLASEHDCHQSRPSHERLSVLSLDEELFLYIY